MPIDKEEQKKLLVELMEADEKDGLYEIKPLTPVQWLKQQYNQRGGTLPSGVFQDALDMEENCIVEAWNDGNLLGRNSWVQQEYSTGKQYYNNTFKK